MQIGNQRLPRFEAQEELRGGRADCSIWKKREVVSEADLRRADSAGWRVTDREPVVARMRAAVLTGSASEWNELELNGGEESAGRCVERRPVLIWRVGSG